MMDSAERIFVLRLSAEPQKGQGSARANRHTLGELWHGQARVPVAGMMHYRGRVDAVITFFVDQFLNDEIFQDGDTLALASETQEAQVVLLRRTTTPQKTRQRGSLPGRGRSPTS